LDPPAKDSNGFLVQKASDLVTGEILYGLNDRYTARPVTFWPPKQSLQHQDKRLEDLYTLMNPPSHLGNIEVAGDDRSFVYATSGMNHPIAIIFVNFDPAIDMGIRRWNAQGRCQRGGHPEDGLSEKQRYKESIARYNRNWDFAVDCSAFGQNWIWKESAMYRVIDQMFEFALRRL
jgi:hypothetical protein